MGIRCKCKVGGGKGLATPPPNPVAQGGTSYRSYNRIEYSIQLFLFLTPLPPTFIDVWRIFFHTVFELVFAVHDSTNHSLTCIGCRGFTAYTWQHNWPRNKPRGGGLRRCSLLTKGANGWTSLPPSKTPLEDSPTVVWRYCDLLRFPAILDGRPWLQTIFYDSERSPTKLDDCRRIVSFLTWSLSYKC